MERSCHAHHTPPQSAALAVRAVLNSSRLVRGQWHLCGGRYANATDPGELNRHGDILHPGISDHRKVQMRTGGKTGATGVGYVQSRAPVPQVDGVSGRGRSDGAMKRQDVATRQRIA